MSEIIFLLAAEIDIQAAFEVYEEIGEGRGAQFLAKLERALGNLRNHPEIGRVYRRKYRRLLISRLPYAIFYSLETKRIIVSAALNLRLNPEIIRRRLRLE